MNSRTFNDHREAESDDPAKRKRVYSTFEKALLWLVSSLVKARILAVQRPPDHHWDYRNADGSVAGVVLQWDFPDGRKEIRHVTRAPGGWINSEMQEPRPLYRLPEIIDAAEIWICESEMSADAAASLGLRATTSSGGSNAARKSDWSPLEGKRVYILPDNDGPGDDYARDVIALIRKQAPNTTILVKRLKEDWPRSRTVEVFSTGRNSLILRTQSLCNLA